MPRLLAGLCVLALLASACVGSTDSNPDAPTDQGASGTDGAALGQGLTAVATVFPLAWLVAEIAPGAKMVFLGSRGQAPHDLELSPADREAIETADVLAFMGPIGFQPQIERAVANASGEQVDVAAIAGDRLREANEEEGADDHENEDDHEDERGAVDPHVWFDATIMADVAPQVGEAFAAADPDHADGYAANAERVAENLAAVTADVDEQLADCRFDTVIVSHEAYAYLLQPRGLEQEGISGTGGHGEASPQRLAELTTRIRVEAIPAIAAEPVEGRADAEALAAESGAELVEVDPLEVADDDMFAVGYPEALREQAAAFATALDCA